MIKKFEKFNQDIDAKDIPTFIKKYGVEDGEHPEIDKDLTKKILDSWGIKSYTINEDGSVDVDGSVTIYFYMLEHNNTELPITFRNIQGSFSVYQCYLTSTKGFPKYVGRQFICSCNQLKTLEGGPEFVGDNYDCSYNKLETLKGSPRHINGDFDCSHNYELKSLEGSPDSVSGTFYSNATKVTSLDDMPICSELTFSQYIRQCEVNAYYDLLYLYKTHPEMVGGEKLNKKVISSLKEFIDIHDDTDFALKTYKDKYYMDLEWVTPFEFDDIKRLLTERDIENEKRPRARKPAPR